MNSFPVIKTDRLLIRSIEMKDKETFFAYRSRPEIYQYQSWKPTCICEVEEFIKKNTANVIGATNTWLQLAVCLKEGPMIGDIGIHFVDDDQIELGYTLSPEYQGQGYAYEAVKFIINLVFFNWKKHRITASVDPGNIRSIKLLKRIGFRKEAHFIKSFFMDHKWCDDCIFAMLEEEWT